MRVPYLRQAVWPALLLFAASAQAGNRYLCHEPPTRVDRRACEAARQGPDELRHFVQRMNWLHHNIEFADYVDEATLLAWERQRAQRTPVAGATKRSGSS